MRTASIRDKHLKLDQKKIDMAKKYLALGLKQKQLKRRLIW